MLDTTTKMRILRGLREFEGGESGGATRAMRTEPAEVCTSGGKSMLDFNTTIPASNRGHWYRAVEWNADSG